MPCSTCLKPINSARLQHDGREWHLECFRCAHCNRPIEGSFIEMNGGFLHGECYDDCYGMRCSRCRGIIKGTFFEHDGAMYCPDDYYTYVAPRCSVCRKVLDGEYIYNTWDQKSCKSHSFKECPSCGRWHGTESQERIVSLCASCSSDEIGVRNLEAYGPGFGTKALALAGIDFTPPVIPIDLVSYISSVPGKEGTGDGITHQGQTLHTVTRSGETEVARTVDGIAILHGLARHHFESVLAHEYGHVWLFFQGMGNLPDKCAEGFCQLLAYLWLGTKHTPESEHLQRGIEKMNDAIYGDGFREMFSRWKQGGRTEILKALSISDWTNRVY